MLIVVTHTLQSQRPRTQNRGFFNVSDRDPDCWSDLPSPKHVIDLDMEVVLTDQQPSVHIQLTTVGIQSENSDMEIFNTNNNNYKQSFGQPEGRIW